MTKLNECDLRRLIMQNTDHTPTTKLTLLALLLKVEILHPYNIYNLIYNLMYN
jgi:hypothetical protein